MEFVRRRSAGWSQSQAALAAYTVVVAALSVVTNLPDALDGVGPAVGRLLLGLLGLAAGSILWLRRDYEILGWRLVLLWSLIQIPVYAWNADGSPTTQFIDFPLTATDETRVNGDVTSSEIGVNLVGIVLTFWAARARRQAMLRRA